MSNEDLLALQTEVEILTQIDHPNVVKLFEIYEDDIYFYMVLELMTGGEVPIHPIHIIPPSYSKESSTKIITAKGKQLKPSNRSSTHSSIATKWALPTET